MANQQYYLNYFSGDRSWGDLTWHVVEPGKLARAKTKLGSYSVALQPNGKTFRLSYSFGSEIRMCPTKFQATNRAQWEADDHYRRLLAQQQSPARLKPPKW